MTTDIASSQLAARAAMIDGQLRPSRISNHAVLAALAIVPRHVFVPQAAQGKAYADTSIALDGGRTMLPPLVQAHLVQSLELSGNENVLVAAAGTGYIAALAAELLPNGHVSAVEDEEGLFAAAQANLADAGVRLVRGNPAKGYEAGEPFDAIVIDAVVGRLPEALAAQLREGGRLTAVVQGADGLPEVTVYVKKGVELLQETLFETGGPVHPAFVAPQHFVF